MRLLLSNKYDEGKIGQSMIFRTRPSRVVIMDTYNNPFYPIPRPQLDKSSFDLPTIFREYRKIYNVPRARFLPWHFTVELVKRSYYVFVTRPLHLKFPLTWEEFTSISDPSLLPDEARKIFQSEGFDTQIFITVIGDSNSDIYPPDFYRVLNEEILMPLRHQFRIQVKTDLINLMGHKFVPSLLKDK